MKKLQRRRQMLRLEAMLISLHHKATAQGMENPALHRYANFLKHCYGEISGIVGLLDDMETNNGDGNQIVSNDPADGGYHSFYPGAYAQDVTPLLYRHRRAHVSLLRNCSSIKKRHSMFQRDAIGCQILNNEYSKTPSPFKGGTNHPRQ